MKRKSLLNLTSVLALAALGALEIRAANAKPAVEAALTDAGRQLVAKYSEQLKALQAEVARNLPKIDEQKKVALQQAREALKKAETTAAVTKETQGKVAGAAGLVEHTKGKWIGGAEKGIAQAHEAIKKATTDAQREAAKKDLAKWEANKEDGLKALKERQAALEIAKAEAAKGDQANQAAQAALAKGRADETSAAAAILAQVGPFLSGDKMDASLVKATVLAAATPNDLAAFAQQGAEQAALVEKLLAE